MIEIFQAIHSGHKASQTTRDLEGRTYGVQLAVVAEVDDPLKLGRVKALLPSKGAKTLTDWLTRAMTWYGLSTPTLTPGDTILVAFIDGDPHQGVYLGILQNIVNPAYAGDKWVYAMPNSQLVMDAEGKLSYTTGSSSLTMDAQGNVSFSGVTSFTINGNEVATVGATDNTGDRLVDRGY